MFKIDYIRIPKNKDRNLKLYKNLKVGTYQFNKKVSDINYWGEGINIQAIVGMNGMGKSSLMDLLYMAINNFAYMFERGHFRPGAESLCYVKGLYLDVGYSSGNNEYILHCKGDLVRLEKNGDLIKSFMINSSPKISNDEIRKLVKEFFYTVVTNYSLQSFISSNYQCDTLVYNRDSNEDDDSENVDKFGLTTEKPINMRKNAIWIDRIFHKNDGYVRSIVLNPYRDNGIINMEIEKGLAQDRLIAFFIDGKKRDSTIFTDYVLDRIYFSLDHEYIQRKFPDKSVPILQEEIMEQLKNKDSEISILLSSFDIEKKKEDILSKPECVAMAYLLQKVKKIVYLYDSYDKFRENKEISIYEANIKKRKKNYVKLYKKIMSENSHVETKIKRTIHFLRNKNDISEWINSLFDYFAYSHHYKNDFSTLDQIINEFPPPIFKYDIVLNRKESLENSDLLKKRNFIGVKSIEEIKKLKNLKKGSIVVTENVDFMPFNGSRVHRIINKNIAIRWNGSYWEKEEINLNSLSSGELQMMHTLSTHAYHIKNLMSIPSNRISYRNFNMIFDEVELSFHPEYQREFVLRLCNMLYVLQRDSVKICNFNVMILTHSPFILSDIPSTNVIYLKKGKQIEVETETFGQNICDLLNQNFFLKSFVGEYSKNKINSLIDYLLNTRKKSIWNKETANIFIENIGDEFLKRNLRKKYEEVFPKRNLKSEQVLKNR